MSWKAPGNKCIIIIIISIIMIIIIIIIIIGIITTTIIVYTPTQLFYCLPPYSDLLIWVLLAAVVLIWFMALSLHHVSLCPYLSAVCPSLSPTLTL